MMQLKHILWKLIAGYKLCKSEKKVNHIKYMDDIKLFVKYKKKDWKLYYMQGDYTVWK